MLTPDDVTTAYLIFLNREPESRQRVDDLMAAFPDHWSLIQHLLGSGEFLERQAMLHPPTPDLTADDVAIAYRLLLGRNPESPDVVDQLLAMYPDRWTLISQIIGGPEYAGLMAARYTPPPSPALSAEDVVTAYALFFGREPESDAAIADLLLSCPDHWTLTQRMLACDEYLVKSKAAYSNTMPASVTNDDVAIAFELFLQRLPETHDTIENIRTQSPDHWALVRHFTSSEEYKIRMGTSQLTRRARVTHPIHNHHRPAHATVVQQRLLDQFAERRN